MIAKGLIASASGLAISLGAYLWLRQALPLDVAQVPVHWGMDGQADGFASREEALALYALLPVASIVIALVLALIPSIEPLRGNLVRSRRAYLTGWIGAQAMIALISVGVAVMTIRSATGETPDSALFVRSAVAGVGVLLAFVGDALPKTRPNFFVGVRTPWTLTSDLAWERTHRLAGRLLVLVGLWAVIAAFVFSGAAMAVAVFAPLIVVVLAVCVYSYFAWRSDPDKRRSVNDA